MDFSPDRLAEERVGWQGETDGWDRPGLRGFGGGRREDLSGGPACAETGDGLTSPRCSVSARLHSG